jgi:hypothetical protein
MSDFSINVAGIRSRDPVPFCPGSGMGKNTGAGSGMNNPDHISESLEPNFWGFNPKIGFSLNYLMQIRDPGWKNQIREGISSDPGSKLNIPDRKQWFFPFRAGFKCWYDTGTCPVDIGGRRICLKYVNIETGVIGEKAKTLSSLPVGI